MTVAMTAAATAAATSVRRLLGVLAIAVLVAAAPLSPGGTASAQAVQQEGSPPAHGGEIAPVDRLATADESGLGLRPVPPASGDITAAPPIPGQRLSLRGLDKLTGEVETFEAPVGERVMFRRMRVEVKACYFRSEARAPESSAFLQIYDTKYDPEPLSFSGWMFASSPALSAMDHGRFDIWVLSCSTS